VGAARFARLARYVPLISGEATMKLVPEPGHGRLVRRTPVRPENVELPGITSFPCE